MFASLVVVVLTSTVSANDQSVVRRSAVVVESQQQHEKHTASARHCVVWRDWQMEGQKFHDKKDADALFEEKKQSELAAFQYDGAHEVRRYLSKRMKNEDFAKMKAWCDGHRSDASYIQKGGHAYTRVSANGYPEKYNGVARSRKPAQTAVAPEPAEHKPFMFEEIIPLPQQMQPMQLFAQQPMQPAFQSVNDYQEASFVQSSRPASLYASSSSSSGSLASSLEAKASTLTDQVGLLEGEMKSVATKVSSLLKQIGSDKLDVEGLSKHQGDHSKLLSRLDGMQEFAATLQSKTALVETELFGMATTSSSADMKQAKHSFKQKIEGLAGQIDELKSRVSAIESAPLLGEAAKLEAGCKDVGSKVGRMFALFGIDGLANPAATVPSGGNMAPMKVRLTTYNGYADNVLRDLAKLEREVLGNSYNSPDRSQRSSASIKDSAAMLAEKLNDIQQRVTTVANAPISNDMLRTEAAASSLSSRAFALAKRVGLDGKISQQGEVSPQQGSTLKVRAAALEAFLDKVQTSTAVLEDELAGNAGQVPAQMQQDGTLKSRVQLLQQRSENLNSRLLTMEQQV